MSTRLKAKAFLWGELNLPCIPAKHRGKNRKILYAGTAVEDVCFETDKQAGPDSLVYVRGKKIRATGGLALNNAIATRMMHPDINTVPLGILGGDGTFIINRLKDLGVPTDGIKLAVDQDTSSTLIPTYAGKKMFIHDFGACDNFGIKTFPFERIRRGDIVVLGYLNLLRQLMANGGRKAQALIMKLRKMGCYVIIDFTDIYEAGFPDLFFASACVSNCVITNETSVAKAVGIEVRKNGKLNAKMMLLAAQTVIDRCPELSQLVVHWPTGSMYYRNDHRVIVYPVHKLLAGDKVGATGAGDNWLVGFLVAAFLGLGPLSAMHVGTTAAEKSLGALSATDASGSIDELEEFDRRRHFCEVDTGFEKFFPGFRLMNWNQMRA